jgi:hypothetical protein
MWFGSKSYLVLYKWIGIWIEDSVEFASLKLSCRLQTGMRGAFGKPQGTVARVRIGQPIMSVRTSDRHRAAVVEALRRAKFKFPGRQKVRFINFLLMILSHLLRLEQTKKKTLLCMQAKFPLLHFAS